MERPEAVAYGPVENGHRPFSAVCLFPRSTATGDYTIKATVIANDKKSGEQSCRLQVEEVGFTRMVDNLASNRRLLYGIMAVLIALFTGGLMGLIFKGGGSH